MKREVSQADCRGQKKYASNLALISAAQTGSEREAMDATEKLIEANLGLVRSIAVRFRERGVDMGDLIQIGIIGMIKAIRSFDLDRGTSFSTYAVPLIFRGNKASSAGRGTDQVGRYYKKLGAMLMNAKNQIVANEGREPRIAELSEICGVSPEEAAVAMDAISPVVSLSEGVYGEENDMGLEIFSPTKKRPAIWNAFPTESRSVRQSLKCPICGAKSFSCASPRPDPASDRRESRHFSGQGVARGKKIIEFLREEFIK
jgi:RNA polymerase sporulation-specific sigma factor